MLDRTAGWKGDATWTAARVDRLKELLALGWSRSQIAADIGGVTRNAVIGKAKRLGLCEVIGPRLKLTHSERLRRIAEQQEAKNQRKKEQRAADRDRGLKQSINQRRRRAPTEVKQPDPDVIENIIPIGQRCTLLELNDENCHWPIGDPGQPDFAFCGGKAETGFPYCGYHARIAYQAPPTEAQREARRKRSVFIPRKGRRAA